MQEEWRAFPTAYELTQFIRGRLFVTVDSLLAQDYNSEEDVKKAHSFIKSFIVFVVKWMKWVAKNPQTVGYLTR